MYTNKTYELDVKKMDKVTGGALAHPGFGKPDSNWPNLPVSGPIPPITQSKGGRLG